MTPSAQTNKTHIPLTQILTQHRLPPQRVFVSLCPRSHLQNISRKLWLSLWGQMDRQNETMLQEPHFDSLTELKPGIIRPFQTERL